MNLDLCVLFGIGCVEWVLAAARTVAIAHGRQNTAALVGFFETALGLGVLRHVLLATDSWPAILVYSAGSAAGIWFGSRGTKYEIAQTETE